MHIPRFWAKEEQSVSTAGRPWLLSVWGWSETSLNEAKQRAVDRAALLMQKLARGAKLDRYGYGEGRLREEIVAAANADGSAVITRNRYGAHVLNTARAMFVDVDLPQERKPGLLGRLLSGSSAGGAADVAHKRLADLEQTLRSHEPQFGCRAYRTAAGLRLLMTHAEYDPASPRALGLLQALGSDPLYVRLCQRQECFRARLTPKPWRIGMPCPTVSWPYTDTSVEARQREWQQRYDGARKRYAACALLRTLGSASVHPSIAPIVQLHDAHALQAGAPLA